MRIAERPNMVVMKSIISRKQKTLKIKSWASCCKIQWLNCNIHWASPRAILAHFDDTSILRFITRYTKLRESLKFLAKYLVSIAGFSIIASICLKIFLPFVNFTNGTCFSRRKPFHVMEKTENTSSDSYVRRKKRLWHLKTQNTNRFQSYDGSRRKKSLHYYWNQFRLQKWSSAVSTRNKNLKTKLASKSLSKGLCRKIIPDSDRHTVESTDLKIMHLLTKKDLYNIKTEFNLCW